MLPADIDDEITRAVILEARLQVQSVDELFEVFVKFRDAVGKPLGFVIHYRRFMPDGRPESGSSRGSDQTSWNLRRRNDFLCSIPVPLSPHTALLGYWDRTFHIIETTLSPI